MRHDPQLRAAARAIFNTCYPSSEWTPCCFEDAERYGTVHYRQSVDAAQQLRSLLAQVGEQLVLPVAI